VPSELARHLFVECIEAEIDALESTIHPIFKPAHAILKPAHALIEALNSLVKTGNSFPQATDHGSVLFHSALHPRNSRFKFNHAPPHVTVVVDDDAIVV
jgi:hypothetical protein